MLDADEEGVVLAAVPLGSLAATDRVTVRMSPARGNRTASIPLPAAIEVRPVRRWAREWNVVGPFPNPRIGSTEQSPALDSVYGPERSPALSGSYTGAGRVRVHWKGATAGADGQVRLVPLFKPSDWVAVYAQAFLYAPRSEQVTLLLGADDAHQLWVNGTKLSERQGRHESKPDELAVPARVHAGWNTILLKVANLDGGWAFQVRAADPRGTLRWSARPGGP